MESITKKLAALGVTGALAFAAAVLIVPHEGKVNETYLDPVGILTACYGHTSPTLRHGQRFTDSQCLSMLAKDLAEHNRLLMHYTSVPLSRGEHAAYLSFVYNAGVGNYKKSTLRKLLHSGQRRAACDELLKWNRQKLPGLDKRRKAERDVCLMDL